MGFEFEAEDDDEAAADAAATMVLAAERVGGAVKNTDFAGVDGAGAEDAGGLVGGDVLPILMFLMSSSISALVGIKFTASPRENFKAVIQYCPSEEFFA